MLPMRTGFFVSGWIRWIIPVIMLSCTHRDLQVDEILCNNKIYPKGTGPGGIRFSWKLRSTERDVVQTAYRVVLTNGLNGTFKEGELIWDSGIRKSNRSILVPYDGPLLDPGTSYIWKVKVWDNHGNESAWSGEGRFITGLEKTEDWQGARWIAYDELDPEQRIVPGIHLPQYRKKWSDRATGDHILPILRHEFIAEKEVKQALVFVSGLGHYKLYINGEKVSADMLSPGWTQYDKICFYNVYDATELIRKGGNCLGMMLGNGFYAVPNTRYRKLITWYGHPAMILMMKLVYCDGSSETLTSNSSWQTTRGPITYSSIYGGEDYNATIEMSGWDMPEYSGISWKHAVEIDPPAGELVAESTFPVKVEQTFEPVSVVPAGHQGAYLYDFGQNASGIMELCVRGNRGDTVILTPGELVTDKLEINQMGSGSPCYSRYILNGNGTETWRQRFTYTGFRYVQVEGAAPGDSDGSVPQILSLKMLHTRNSAPTTGTFRTSDELSDRIFSLILWAVRSNFQSVLTDCPHREKLGWLEQSYLMGGSVHYNYDVYHLYCKIIDDMIRSQGADGLVPCIAPEYTRFEGNFRDSPEWGSACVILPWLVYRWYGDMEQVGKAWDMMTRYADYLKGKADHQILSHGLGDWNDLGPDNPGYSQLTPVALTATAIYCYDLELLGRMGDLLGKYDTAEIFRARAERVREAFNRSFFDAAGATYATGSQTAMSMPLVLGLVEERYRARVLSNLIDSINTSGKALTAGDVGYYFLIRALQQGDANQLICEMNEREDVPGYAYQMKMGATALTESWSALSTLSNNHLMLGHLMEWFYSGLAGIDQTEASVAYNEVLIEPHPCEGIRTASAEFESPHGRISSSWERTPGGFDLEISIPVNAHALIRLPDGYGYITREKGKKGTALVKGTTSEDQVTGVVRTGSGRYRFNIVKRESTE